MNLPLAGAEQVHDLGAAGGEGIGDELAVAFPGPRLGERIVGTSGDEVAVRVPADALFRGDNVLTLSALDGPGLRFRSLVLTPVP